MANDELIMVLIRGDLRVNDVKLKNILDTVAVELASEEDIAKTNFTKGFLGPQSIKGIKIIADRSVINLSNHVTGANKVDYHCINANYGRDYNADIVADIERLELVIFVLIQMADYIVPRGIECGHIFKLGTKYSEALKATYLDEKGETQTMIMGCYGLNYQELWLLQ